MLAAMRRASSRVSSFDSFNPKSLAKTPAQSELSLHLVG
jgi:hypothetical protein